MSNDHESPTTVQWSKEVVHFSTNTTQRFEQYLLEKQVHGGKYLTKWEHLGDCVFELIFDQLIEDKDICMNELDWQNLTKHVQVNPWQFYLFDYPTFRKGFFVQKGKKLTVARLVSDYSDIYGMGDPIQFVSLENNQVIGSGTVVATKKVAICDMSAEDYLLLQECMRNLATPKNLIEHLSAYYGRVVDSHEILSLLTFRVDQDMGTRGKRTNYQSQLLRLLFKVKTQEY